MSRACGTSGGGGQSDRSRVAAAEPVWLALSVTFAVTLWVVMEQLFVTVRLTLGSADDPDATVVPRTAIDHDHGAWAPVGVTVILTWARLVAAS